MISISAVPVPPEVVATATPMRPDAPPRETIGPPDRPAAVARGSTADPARADDGSRDFATALAGEMDSGDADAAPADVEGRGASSAATGKDAGEAAPLDGNGLPPWLAGLPPAVPPAVGAPTSAGTLAAAVLAADATPPPSASGADPTVASRSAVVPSSVPLAAGVEPAAPAEIDIVSADPTAAVPPSADTSPARAPAALPQPDGRAALAQARADGGTPAPPEPVLPPATRAAEASSAMPPGEASPAVAGDVLRRVADAIGRRATPGAAGSSNAPAAPPNAAPRSPAAVAATPVVEAPAASLPRRAASIVLAAESASAVDGAPAAPPSPALAAAVATPPSPAPGPAASAPVAELPVPVGAPDWDRALGERVGVLVDQGLTNAQLKLSPAHLGPLEIRISVQNDQANVWFGTHSHATREALEAAAPRLRDMLGAQGFSNVGVSVDLQQQASRQGAPTSRYEPEYSFGAGGGADSLRATPGTSATRGAGRARLDAFA